MYSGLNTYENKDTEANFYMQKATNSSISF